MSAKGKGSWQIRIGLASCGIASGARKVYEALQNQLGDKGLDVELKQTGCIGMCYNEPLIEVSSPRKDRIFYGKVTPDKVERIVNEHLVGGNPVAEWVTPEEEIHSVLGKQKRIVLRNCGIIDPESIDDYLTAVGYKAIEKALSSMSPQEVIDEMTNSGLRGRGGAGFPTGIKWGFARKAPSAQKYIICNADEGDPGAFMDRSVLEGTPHAVLEGMMIAGLAIGACHSFIYVRTEYPLAVKNTAIAIEQARTAGLLGENILGSKFCFEIEIREGAGAFVCGEETALIASLEGNRGMPRSRPPFPVQKGYMEKPTTINNVETLVNVPLIIRNGAEWYSEIGTEKSKGTKIFALAGKVNNTGLVEVPMGTTLRQIIFDIGGGITNGRKFKAAQMGGPSGGCIRAKFLDHEIDYDSVEQLGAIMGSGGLIVTDDQTCMVDLARYFLEFVQSESCGKCTPCRVGTKKMLNVLDDICSGNAKIEDLDELEELAKTIKKAY